MLNPDKKLYVAHSNGPLFILPKMANRHGLIAGATGTGKLFLCKYLQNRSVN